MAELDNASFEMEYDEESIIKARLAARERKRLSIKNDIVEIDGVAHKFTRREFAYGFSMVVPEKFEEMPREIARRIFPYEDRPEIILSDGGFRTCLAFNKTERPAGGLEDRSSSFRGYIKRICPAAVFFSNGIYRLPDGVDVAHYDYRYPAADDDLYDLTFFTDFMDTELLGWFICPAESKDKWEPLIREIIQTLQIEEKEP
ncbi:hypothetical protein FACS1894171_0870 [Clostridia bacterium]|nr:hypothetical protein FACS1894171_0870 [Clostridia bacterium]